MQISYYMFNPTEYLVQFLTQGMWPVKIWEIKLKELK